MVTKTKRPRVGVYVCHCGINIAGAVDVAAVAAYARELPQVRVARDYLYMCSQPGQDLIRADIASGQVNRVVVASCSPRMHEVTFRAAVQESGLNPYFFEQANIREQCAWVNPAGAPATAKAKALVGAAVGRVARHEPLSERSVTVRGAALVIGGGLAGMTTALHIADAGFPVTLVEKTAALGGHAADWYCTFPTLERVDDLLGPLIARVQNHGNISVRTSNTVVGISGYIGNFEATIADEHGESTLPVGAIVVAVGFNPFDARRLPELGHGKYDQVLTSVEMEQTLRVESERLAAVKDVVLVSCVGSRNKQVGNPYCSRVCCLVNMKQAHLLRQQLPEAHITVLYTDVRAFGNDFETFYDRVRSERVLYRRGSVSQISRQGDRLLVHAEDTLLRRPVRLETDLVVLGVGMTPRPEHEMIANLFKLARSDDGFFMEKHPKLGPVDTMVDGVFLAGSCQAPRDMTDTADHARAAAAAALVPLMRGEVAVEAAVSTAAPEMCAGCGLCVANCPYDALAVDSRVGAVRVNPALCKGCGACASVCPSGAIAVQHFRPEQILAQIDALLMPA